MGLDGRLGDDQLRSDLGVRQTAGDEAEHAELAIGERGQPGRYAGDDHGLGEPLQQPLGDGRLDQRVARRCGTHRGDEARGGRVPEQETGGAGAQGAVDVLELVEGGQDDDRGWVRLSQDLFRRSESVELGLPDVHKHDVGPHERRLTDRLVAVLGLSHDLDVRLGLQDHPEAGAHELLVVGDEDSDHLPILPPHAAVAGPPRR